MMGERSGDLELSEALAFLGNSFLKPMRQTSDAGLDPSFWASFPDFEDKGVSEARDTLFVWASQGKDQERTERIQEVSVEYARLFIGPPEPMVAPWESFYVQEGVSTGFGEPTFRMQERLRSIGLVVSNENNQYADHIGIELLYCSAYLKQAVQDDRMQKTVLGDVIREDLLPWASYFSAALDKVSTGYYARLAGLAVSVLMVCAQRCHE